MSELRDLLLLVNVDVNDDVIGSWDADTKQLVEDWAVASHLDASDNNVGVPPCPEVLLPYTNPAVMAAMTKIKEHLRLTLTRYLGHPAPTEQQLRAACDAAILRASSSDLIPLRGCQMEIVLRMTFEVGFGLRDPKDLFDALEQLSDDQLKELEKYGPGPGNAFALVPMKRRGDIDFVITDSRPGMLNMTVTFKHPLNWIRLDVVLDEEES